MISDQPAMHELFSYRNFSLDVFFLYFAHPLPITFLKDLILIQKVMVYVNVLTSCLQVEPLFFMF